MKSLGFYASLFLLFLALQIFVLTDAMAQRAATPVTGRYPGGHVGLMGGRTPSPGGFRVANISKFSHFDVLKDSKGHKIENINTSAYASITALEYVTDWKIFGMNLGGLHALPVNDLSHRPIDGGQQWSGFGVGDFVTIPLYLFGKSKSFDYQIAAGVWTPTGNFKAGGTKNHGAGFWEMIYSVGGMYYPGGDRLSWNFSAVARYEQNFKQKDTHIKVGDDIVVDYGFGKIFVVGQSFKQVVNVGISGFAEFQVTKETGANRAQDTSKYRLFAIGPEIQYGIPKWNTGLILRYQPQFGARNTSQGKTFWLVIGHEF